MELSPGDKVAHPTFGIGRVESVRGDAATVRFGATSRTILLSHLERQTEEGPSRPSDAKTLFDAYLVVDWSAGHSEKYGADTIWYCLLEPAEGRLLIMNPGTRALAVEGIRERLADLVSRKRRVLVGLDFPYGYPTGTAERLGFEEGEPWRVMWDLLSELVEDEPNNHNNRFEVAAQLNGGMTTGPAPFWGCPTKQVGPFLEAKRPKPWPEEIPEFRLTDRRAGAKSPWQLHGAGSVGGQALVGIPRLAALRDDAELSEISRVWPFETGSTPALPGPGQGPFVLHVEVYPSLVPPSPFEDVKDAAQVRALAEHLATLDDEGELGDLFDLSPLAAEELEPVVAEEGWILGLRPPGPES